MFRRDRDDGHGGVIVATKSNLIAREVNIKDISAEVVLVKIWTGHPSKTLVKGAIYRTPSGTGSDQISNMSNIIKCLDKLNINDTLWLGGDFNLPDIDWANEHIVGHQYPVPVNRTFLDKTRDLGLTQINNTHARGDNILDLLLTNRSGLVAKTSTIAGLSDHDILITDNKLITDNVKSAPHTVSIWRKANITAMKTETTKFCSELECQSNLTVEDTWSQIYQHLQTLMVNYLPTKVSSKKYHQPWINSKLKRLSRKKQRAWTKAKVSNSVPDWENYKGIK